MKKVFLITIDTEADNQWDINHECTTQNARFLPRFQELAEKYGYKPVWLTTYEMANDESFVKYFKNKQDNNLCEIGMHLHAWNNPPEYNLKKNKNTRPYLIEYPFDIMEKKIMILDKLLTEKFEKKPISHRAGRWTTNKDYFELLKKYGYKIDCSMTPHINWEKNLGVSGQKGSNYKNVSEKAFILDNNILEVPVTIRKIRTFYFKNCTSLKRTIRSIQYFIFGKKQWIRPDKNFLIKEMKKAIDICDKNNEYIMFMIHSSELMPNGSPNFKTEEDIERLYKIINEIFEFSKNKGYIGMTLREYYNYINNLGD